MKSVRLILEENRLVITAECSTPLKIPCKVKRKAVLRSTTKTAQGTQSPAVSPAPAQALYLFRVLHMPVQPYAFTALLPQDNIHAS